ncbi:hypothetical protein E1B28_004541 [Marasmius oreades]|uniref:DNA replication complex GINS protein PSF3 n=1 Tax=Marasmius oreades TaxID=181124 RepID=A0A9P7UYT3_9AGAR|nr:uncharacterized protein E1B28_004541 [Marasmius oreades]KAG7097164.1 hypothetical protein E1B28_004541 [Marasmius oreades]
MDNNDYFSIDAILAENQKLQLTFTQPIPDMGHLGGGSENDIAPNAKRQIPVWLVYTIVYLGYAEFNIPPPFSSKVRNALRAEPRSVRLSNLVGAGGLWYGFGKTITEMLSDEQGKEMSEMLTSVRRQTQIFSGLTHGIDLQGASRRGHRSSPALRCAGSCGRGRRAHWRFGTSIS